MSVYDFFNALIRFMGDFISELFKHLLAFPPIWIVLSIVFGVSVLAIVFGIIRGRKM